MVTCNMSSGSRDRKPAEAVQENIQEYQRGNFNYSNHNHGHPTAIAIREIDYSQLANRSNSNANLDEETPMEVSPTVRQVTRPKMDHHDHPEEVHVSLYIKKILEDSLKAEFEEHNVQVTFKTQDKVFLETYVSADENDIFQWRIETHGPIVPEKCSVRLKPTKLDIKLIKAVTGNWKTLESSTATGQTTRLLQREKWIPLAPPKTPPRPPAIADGNANEDDEPRSPATASASPAVPTKIGYTGLGNLGNTCYMNAVLQCLANVTSLRNYFLGKNFQCDLNRDNPLGFGGGLAVAFAVVIRQLWSGQRDSIEPSHLKNLLANKAPQFSGYQQHDAQEFMAFLLDGLHEDLNRVKKKPQTMPVESNGRPDSVVADEAWRVYKLRNDSVIVDFFQGQYKSTLVCPSCDKVSVTFDPFLYLALPLPPLKSCFNVTLFFAYDPSVDSDDHVPHNGAVKVSLWLDPNERVEHLKRELKQRCANRFRQQNSDIELVQVRGGRVQRWLLDQQHLSSLSNSGMGASLYGFEYTLSTEEPQVQITVTQRVLEPLNDFSRCSACHREGVALKRCLKCFSVAYCDKSCQNTHWKSVHQSLCRASKPQIIGEPFCFSLPAASLTFDRLYKTMLHYARFSVDVIRPASSPCDGNDSTSSHDLDSSASSTSSSPPHRRESHSGSEDTGADAGAAALREKSASEKDSESQEPSRLFFIKPTDATGQGKQKRLDPHGDELIQLEANDSPIFLTLDWRNKSNVIDRCIVSPRTEIDCETLDDDNEDSEIALPGFRSQRTNQNRGVTLEDCLRQFMQPEVLSREEAWYCPKCKEHREATKQMSVWRLPEILTIQLKRFSFRNLMWRDKIDQKVEFPTRGLDLSPYLSTTVSSGPDKGAVYDLFAVVNHYGSILYGHYTAFARCPANDADNNQENLVGWRCMDDRQVRDVSEESVVTPAAYLLLYKRRKSDAGNTTTVEAATGASGSLPIGAAGSSGPSPGSSSARLRYSDPEEID